MLGQRLCLIGLVRNLLILKQKCHAAFQMKEDNNLCTMEMEKLSKCNYYKKHNMTFREVQVNTKAKKIAEN